MSEDISLSSDSIAKINKIVQKIQSSIQSEQGLLDFNTIEFPFQLVDAAIALWESTYSPDVLRQLASNDSETLEAWAIALSQTLNSLLKVLNCWLPLLSTFPISPKLQDRIRDYFDEIKRISYEKSQLLQVSADFLRQEPQLRSDAEELSRLRQKDEELKGIEAELQSVDLDRFRQEITAQSTLIEPKAKELEQLKQQKAEIEAQITELHHQKGVLENEIERQKLKQKRQQTTVLDNTQELITLTRTARTRLDEPLTIALTDLEEQRSEYQQSWEKLQAAIQAFNQYQVETDEIRTHLNAHYQTDQDISQLLPVDRQKVNTIIQTIQDNLAQLDRELANARTQHEQSQQKTILTF